MNVPSARRLVKPAMELVAQLVERWVKIRRLLASGLLPELVMRRCILRKDKPGGPNNLTAAVPLPEGACKPNPKRMLCVGVDRRRVPGSRA